MDVPGHRKSLSTSRFPNSRLTPATNFFSDKVFGVKFKRVVQFHFEKHKRFQNLLTFQVTERHYYVYIQKNTRRPKINKRQMQK